MYVVSSCKGRDSTLQGGVIHVTIVLQSSFFCLETKERSKEKFKADFFLLLASFTSLKGRNSLRSNSPPFLTPKTKAPFHAPPIRPGRLRTVKFLTCGVLIRKRPAPFVSNTCIAREQHLHRSRTTLVSLASNACHPAAQYLLYLLTLLATFRSITTYFDRPK